MKPILSHFAAATALTFSLAACIPQVEAPTSSTAAPVARPAPMQSAPPATNSPAVATPSATPAPAPIPVLVSQPAVQSNLPDNWMDQPRTPGDWRYRPRSEGGIAEYVSTSGTILFQMDCTPEIGVLLSIAGTNFNASAMQIRTETANRRLAADAREGWIQSVLRPQDRFLDAMAVTKGNFAVQGEGLPPLYLPGWAEVTRVIEDCR